MENWEESHHKTGCSQLQWTCGRADGWAPTGCDTGTGVTAALLSLPPTLGAGIPHNTRGISLLLLQA